MAQHKILFLQFTNPAAYPPLENSARILADMGWLVRFFGVDYLEVSAFRMEPHASISVELLPARLPGWRQKLFYLSYGLGALWRALIWRPDWIYVSDPMASPVGLLLAWLGFRVIYHEHDAPNPVTATSCLIRWVFSCRNHLARRAQFNVLPQETRITVFQQETRTDRPVYLVWNCPPRREALEGGWQRRRLSDEPLGIYYHGSINLNRVPLTLIEAAARCGVPVTIRIAGYETIGSNGACHTLRSAAEATGGKVTIEFAGSTPHHSGLARNMSGMHIGWINFLDAGEDFNLTHMVGASNKAFDYLARALPLIVPETPDWVDFFVRSGTGKAVDASNPDAIATVLRWFYENPDESAQMGEAGRQKILAEWNYESQFGAVKEVLAQGIHR